MKPWARVLSAVDSWQRRHKVAAITYAVVKKFGDDNANLYVVALGWYGFTAIYPLLLVVVSIFGFIGVGSLGAGVVGALRQFPVIGSQLSPDAGTNRLQGSLVALAVGLAGLIYGAQGVTQVAQQSMAQAWNVAQFKRPAFLPRLARSLGGLAVIGGAFVINALVGSVAVASGHGVVFRVAPLAVLFLVDVLLYLAAFAILTAAPTRVEQLVPGAIVGGASFTLLTTVGTGLVQHQLRHAQATYGTFGAVIGVVTYLLLLAKVSVLAAELNTVLARRLWPRSLNPTSPTDADEQVLRDLAHQQRSREEERIGVGFEPGGLEEAARDAERPDPRPADAA